MAAAEVSSAPGAQPPHFPHSRSDFSIGADSASWSNSNPPMSRGRQPKDPQAITTRFECASLQDLERNLRTYLDNPPPDPEHAACELIIWAGASFMVQMREGEPGGPPVRAADAESSEPRHRLIPTTMAMSVLDALQPSGADPKDTMRRQRAIARVCVAAIQGVDGYRYSFHNSWRSGEDDAFRFSFYCNDSLLNKDRVASGKAGSSGKRAHKPVFDCKGVLSIKFSSTRQCIDVIYKHVPLHGTYEERAPPPRKEAKRRAEWEARNPDKVKKSKPPEETNARPRKRQRKSAPAYVSVESELLQESRASLLELIRIDQGSEQPPQPAPVSVPAPVSAPASSPLSPPQPRNEPRNEANDTVEQRAMAALTLNANNDLRREMENLKSDFELLRKELEDERRKTANYQERCTQLEAENQTLREAATASMSDTAPQPQGYPSQMMSMPPRHPTSQPAPRTQSSEHQMYTHYPNRPSRKYLQLTTCGCCIINRAQSRVQVHQCKLAAIDQHQLANGRRITIKSDHLIQTCGIPIRCSRFYDERLQDASTFLVVLIS